jgi:hypothetical protein
MEIVRQQLRDYLKDWRGLLFGHVAQIQQVLVPTLRNWRLPGNGRQDNSFRHADEVKQEHEDNPNEPGGHDSQENLLSVRDTFGSPWA